MHSDSKRPNLRRKIEWSAYRAGTASTSSACGELIWHDGHSRRRIRNSLVGMVEMVLREIMPCSLADPNLHLASSELRAMAKRSISFNLIGHSNKRRFHDFRLCFMMHCHLVYCRAMWKKLNLAVLGWITLNARIG
jgi:hypothetical protein